MATTPPQTRPQSPLNYDELTRLAHAYDNLGPCGRFTQFFVRNLALFLLLAVGLVGLVALFHPTLSALMGEHCRIHRDEYFGKLWLECPEPLRRVFRPRPY